MSLFRAVKQQAIRAPDSLALLSPPQSIRLTYLQLATRASVLAQKLEQSHVGKSDIVLTNLPNVAEGVVLQLALQKLRASVATAKNEASVLDFQKTMSESGRVISGAVAAAHGDWLSSWASSDSGQRCHVLLGGTILEVNTPDNDDVLKEEFGLVGADFPLGYFNSSKPLVDQEAVQLGENLAAKLDVTSCDRVAVAITLYHQFSHMAMNAIFSRGATLVLPAVGGLHGCGVPSQRAAATLSVMVEEKCSLLVADTHTVKALNGEDLKIPLRDADLGSLRGGVCKVASGAEFLDPVVELKGVNLVTLGKR